MAELQILTTLRAKQAEIETYIRNTEKRLTQARTDLAHVSATIRIFETIRDETTEFPVYVRLNSLFRRGELPKLCHDAIKGSPDGKLDTRQVAAHVMAARGWDASDKALLVSISSKVVHALDDIARRRRGIVRAGRRNGVNVWGLSQ